MEKALEAIREQLNDIAGGTGCTNDPTGPSSKLWAILTALRGPDDNNYWLKRATTCVIRWKLGVSMHIHMAMVDKDSQDSANFRANYVGNTHFIQHAKGAFVALGLKWNEVNR